MTNASASRMKLLVKTTLLLMFSIVCLGVEDDENVTLSSVVVTSTEDEFGITEISTRGRTAAPANIPEIKRAHQVGVTEQQQHATIFEHLSSSSSSSTTTTDQQPFTGASKETADEDDVALSNEQQQHLMNSTINEYDIEVTEMNLDATKVLNRSKEVETMLQTSFTSPPLTSTQTTDFFSEDTLPAEVTAADPFATTPRNDIQNSSTSSDADQWFLNATTMPTELASTEMTTGQYNIATDLITISFINEESLSTTEQDVVMESSSLHPIESTTTLSVNDHENTLESDTNSEQTSTSSTLSPTTLTSILVETTTTTTTILNEATIAEPEDDNINENIFIGDKSLFNEQHTIKSFEAFTITTPPTNIENVTTQSSSSSSPPPPPPINDESIAATEYAVSMSTDAPSSFSIGTAPTIIPVLIPKQLTPISRLDEEEEEEESGGNNNREEHTHTEPSNEMRPFDVENVNEQPIMESTTTTTESTLKQTDEETTETTKANEDKLERDEEEEEEVTPETYISIKPNQEEEEEVEQPTSPSSPTIGSVRPHRPHQQLPPTVAAFKTPYSFRITSIDYTNEFENADSGKSRKLRDQLIPDLEEIFGAIFTTTYRGVSIDSITKGSVAIDGNIYLSIKPDNTEQMATEFEQRVTAKGAQIGGNDVDLRSIMLNGFVSKNYVERVHEGYTSGGSSAYLIGGGIAIGIIAILVVAFSVIAMNNRRTNGTLKLKDDSIAMTENGGRGLWNNNSSSNSNSNTSPPVNNLMGFSNKHQHSQSHNRIG